MLEKLHELEVYKMFWFVTITPYGRDIEPHVPDKMRVIEDFIKLSNSIGTEKISWRYDPIFISNEYSLEYHIRSFEKIAESLSGHTHSCVISFIDLYEKTKRNFPQAKEVTKAEQIMLAKEFVRIGKKYDITIRGCAEERYLESYGVDVEGCMTQSIIEKVIGMDLNVPKRKPARETCNCLLGSDIGAYNTCGHGCKYCYANYDTYTVRENMILHNPKSPFLVGGSLEGDVIKDAKQKSFIERQIKFF